jgi:hypothetical protein
MLIEEFSSITVTCDNPTHDAVGNPDMDPSNLTGWLLVTHEVYGDTSTQSVFCSSACVSAASGAAGKEGTW